jgi:hypothetical protein
MLGTALCGEWLLNDKNCCLLGYKIQHDLVFDFCVRRAIGTGGHGTDGAYRAAQ